MSEQVNNFLTAVSYWKMALVKLACQVVLGVGGTMIAGLNDLDWADFSPTQKFKFFTGVCMTAASVVLAFCSTTMADMQSGNPNAPKTNP